MTSSDLQLPTDLSLDEEVLCAPDRTPGGLTLDSPIGALPCVDRQVYASELGNTVAQTFARHPDLPGLLVVGGRRDYDVLSRREFFDKLARDFGHTPFLTEPIGKLLATDHQEGLTLSAETPIHQAGPVVLERSQKHAYEPIIVCWDDGRRKLLDPYVLLLAQARLVSSVNDEIQKKREKAEAAAKAKTAFVANVSHEIRTPLNGIIGFAESIVETDSLETARSRAQTILRESEHLLGLINVLLDHAKIEAGKLELEYLPLDPRQLVEEVLASAAVKVRNKPVKLSAVVDRRVPDCFLADPLRLRQILNNLVGNAVKFTDSGSVTVRIDTQEWHPEWAVLRFAVTDTGIGIPPEKQETIFDNFAQADGSTSRKYGGTGLGTSIARHLVELMGGRMELTSEVGKGSEFFFLLEVESAEAPPAREPGPEPPSVTLDEKGHAARVGRILIAEDYPTNQEVVRMHLERVGHELVVVDNGAQALEACRGGEFDLIFMDVQMPEMDGLEATRRIRQEVPGYNDVPIVALTANGEMDTHLACLDAGMNDMITKPVRRNSLLTAVSAWISNLSAGGSVAFVRTTPPPPEPAESDEPMCMTQAVEEFGGNRELVDSVLKSFLEQVEGQIRVLRSAIDNGDAETLRKEAHKVKGGAANLTAMPLSRSAAELENTGRTGSVDGAEELLEEFRAQFARLREYVIG
ncbi:MAG: ATP-binding protein [Phycisphaerae bacterium]